MVLYVNKAISITSWAWSGSPAQMETAPGLTQLSPDVKEEGTEGLWQEGEREENKMNMNFTIIKTITTRCVGPRGKNIWTCCILPVTEKGGKIRNSLGLLEIVAPVFLQF